MSVVAERLSQISLVEPQVYKNPALFPLIAEYDDHAILWRLMPDDWTNGPFSSEPPDMLPYFVDGEEYEKLTQEQGIGFTPYALLCGILLSWNESGNFWKKKVHVTPHHFLVNMLDNLRRDAGIDSIEEMILKAAASIRDAHDPLLSSRILMAGRSIQPGSVRICCTLILDLWMVLEITDEVDTESALKMIISAYQEGNVFNIMTEVFEVLDYIYLVSLSFLGRSEERDAFFQQTAPRWHYYPALRDLMLKLIKDDDPDFHAYRMWNRREFYH